MTRVINRFLHRDDQLPVILTNYGAWTYAILLPIVFCKTGLAVAPFLPGDPLLFAVGTFAGKSEEDH